MSREDREMVKKLLFETKEYRDHINHVSYNIHYNGYPNNDITNALLDALDKVEYLEFRLNKYLLA